MTVGFQTNNFNTSAITSPNINHTETKNTPNLKTKIKDVLSLSTDKTMKEAIIKKTIWGKTSYEGIINGEVSSLLAEKTSLTIFGENKVSGNIGDKDANITYKNKKFQGNIGDNSFDLKVSSFGIFKSKISGTINGEPVTFNLKSDDLPQNKDVQNILTTILMLNGQEAKIKDGKFKGLMMADWSQNEAALMYAMNNK